MARKSEVRGWSLHSDGDGVVGVAGDVPARPRATLRQKRPAAGNIFFGMNHVEFVGGFVALVGNGKETDAMNGTGGRAQFGKMQAKFVPGEVHEVNEHE